MIRAAEVVLHKTCPERRAFLGANSIAELPWPGERLSGAQPGAGALASAGKAPSDFNGLGIQPTFREQYATVVTSHPPNPSQLLPI